MPCLTYWQFGIQFWDTQSSMHYTVCMESLKARSTLGLREDRAMVCLCPITSLQNSLKGY